MNVVVYLKADDVRMLRAAEKDPAVWVRDLVKWALPREKEKHERVR